jgi:hypothetical protein
MSLRASAYEAVPPITDAQNTPNKKALPGLLREAAGRHRRSRLRIHSQGRRVPQPYQAEGVSSRFEPEWSSVLMRANYSIRKLIGIFRGSLSNLINLSELNQTQEQLSCLLHIRCEGLRAGVPSASADGTTETLFLLGGHDRSPGVLYCCGKRSTARGSVHHAIGRLCGWLGS